MQGLRGWGSPLGAREHSRILQAWEVSRGWNEPRHQYEQAQKRMASCMMDSFVMRIERITAQAVNRGIHEAHSRSPSSVPVTISDVHVRTVSPVLWFLFKAKWSWNKQKINNKTCKR